MTHANSTQIQLSFKPDFVLAENLPALGHNIYFKSDKLAL